MNSNEIDRINEDIRNKTISKESVDERIAASLTHLKSQRDFIAVQPQSFSEQISANSQLQIDSASSMLLKPPAIVPKSQFEKAVPARLNRPYEAEQPTQLRLAGHNIVEFGSDAKSELS